MFVKERCSVKHLAILGLVGLGLLAVACGTAEPPAPEDVRNTGTPILNGVDYDQAYSQKESVVWIRLLDGSQGTGVLVRNDWVLTARHVVMDANATPPAPYAPYNVLIRRPYKVSDTNQDPSGYETQITVDRILFHPIGPRVEVALLHLAHRANTYRGIDNERVTFYESNYADLVDKPVVCYGYGLKVSGDLETTGVLRWGISKVTWVNHVGPTLRNDPIIMDASLPVFTTVVPWPNMAQQIPIGGDSGGPCYYGEFLIGTVSWGDDPPETFDAILQANSYKKWVEEVLAENAAAELDYTTDPAHEPTASPDILTIDYSGSTSDPLGTLHILHMGTNFDGTGLVPEFESENVIGPEFPLILMEGGHAKFQLLKGMGNYNQDTEADFTTAVVDYTTFPPTEEIRAHLSSGPAERSEHTPILSHSYGDGWDITSVADIDGDGVSDLVWMNYTTQFAGNYYVTNVGLKEDGGLTAYNGFPVAAVPQRDSNGADIPGTRDPAWKLVAVGDLDRAEVVNGKLVDRSAADLVWHNQDTGEVKIWLMDFVGGAYVKIHEMPIGELRSPSSWEVVAFADYDHDGTSDLVWRNRDTTDGLLEIWTQLLSSTSTGISEIPLNDSAGNPKGIGLDYNVVGPR
jgi:hypothetical protein